MAGLVGAMRRYVLPIVLLCAFGIRTALILVTKSYENPSTWEFGRIASYLADGKGYALWRWDGSKYTQAYSPDATPLPSAYMPPLYPLLLAGCYRLLGEPDATYLLLQGVQASLGAMTCWLVYLLARRLWDAKVGLWAAWACALYPPLVYMASTMHPINFYVPAYLVVVYLAVALLHADHWWIWLAFSACSATLIMFRAEALLYVLAFYIWIGWRRSKIYITSSHLISSLLLLVLLMLPWAWRNLRALGHWVPTTTTLGYNLWRGNNPEATGTGRSLAGVDEPTPQDIEAEINAIPLERDFELQMDKVFMQRALHFIRTRPLSAIALALRKQVYFWVSDLTHPLARTPYYLIPTAALALFAFAGLVSRKPQSGDCQLLYLAIFLPAGTASVFFVLPRYRMFIDPLLMIPAANGVSRLRDWLLRSAKRRSRP